MRCVAARPTKQSVQVMYAGEFVAPCPVLDLALGLRLLSLSRILGLDKARKIGSSCGLPSLGVA